ncbi:energy transducer TonB [Psychrobacter sp. ANT_H3]|uniref:energy transducer TonB n=1 Tax=Psychrobacter sp. ANT_H3 TaxID=3019444 RepID=UPI0022F18721|nr:energy transducer TonB [Psychrobacter sp. ANT_H3]MDA5134348.1 TonB family protein [Psychrobacter sp. ANT_H3]
MSSTDLDAPPLKAILIAIIVVVGLHVLTAVALVTIKPSEPKIERVQVTPPIEIEFVSLPAPNTESEVEAEQLTAQQKPQPKVKPERIQPPQPQPQPQQKPIAEPKAKVVTAKPTERKSKTADVEPVAKVENKKPDVIKKEPPKIDTSMADEQRKIIAAQAEKAAQDAHARAVADAKAAREAQAPADDKAATEAAQKAAQAKAEREAAAQAKADADAKAAASASNEPVNFTASNANWASAPNFNFPERAAKRARSGDTLNVVLILRVNKQGGIDSVRIAQSSGNSLVDKEAQRQVRSGKFKPFSKNGVPVVGNVTLPIAYAVP